MSQFNHYAKEAEKTTKQAVEKMVAVKADFDAAEKKMNSMPINNYPGDRVYQAKATLAREEWQEQMRRRSAAGMDLPQKLERDLKKIRQQLEADLAEHFTASPKQVDSNMLELAKSGILSFDEYARMIEDSIRSGNHTMARLIAKYAKDAIPTDISKNDNNPKIARLRASIAEIERTGPNAYLGAFDGIIDMALRCVRTPSMMKNWDYLLGDLIKNF